MKKETGTTKVLPRIKAEKGREEREKRNESKTLQAASMRLWQKHPSRGGERCRRRTTLHVRNMKQNRNGFFFSWKQTRSRFLLFGSCLKEKVALGWAPQLPFTAGDGHSRAAIGQRGRLCICAAIFHQTYTTQVTWCNTFFCVWRNAWRSARKGGGG